MSFNVLVIPEDATNDHYVLKPVLRALLGRAGKPQAVVQVLVDPAVQGIDQALDVGFLRAVIRRYPMVDLFLLCVDRDGRPGRDESVADRETGAQDDMSPSQRFLGTAAHQELETWCLAGMADLPRQWAWQEVRAEVSCKERFFTVYAGGRGLLDAPGDGREVLGREAAGRYGTIRSRCPEVAALEERVREAARG